MDQRLASEFIDAFNRQRAAMNTRDNMHRMADANKAFAHFAWSGSLTQRQYPWFSPAAVAGQFQFWPYPVSRLRLYQTTSYVDPARYRLWAWFLPNHRVRDSLS
jgi:hypothetical protein